MKPAQEADGTLFKARRIVIGGISGAFGVFVAERRSKIRPSQQFRPGANLSLEDRIALSSFAQPAHAEHALFAQTQPTPNILSVFPREAAGLAAGNPVYEQWTSTFYDGLSQTDDETYVLNNQTVTVTENITLRGGAGTESAVDHFTAIPGGVLFQNTFTLPNGQTETESRVETFRPVHRIIQNGSIMRPDGVTVAFTTNSVTNGAKTTINSSFHESNGINYTVHEVDQSVSEWQSSETVTTKWADGSHQVNKVTVSGAMLSSPPS
jgi:hypothetical protein